MFINVLSVLGLILLLFLFVYLARRSWRSSRPILRWGGLLLSGLLSLVFAALTVFSLLGMRNMYFPAALPVPGVVVEGTPEQIARGEHLAASFCTSCHSSTGDLPLTGGLDLGQDLAINLGKFISANLTPAGSLQDWTDGEIMRALRNGIDKDGRRLAIMSSVRARNMSDEDMLALIAYLRASQPVPSDVPQTLDQPNLLGLIMSGVGMIPIPSPISGSISAPPKDSTAEYGMYILSYNDCRDCHGEDLTGGVKGQLAPIGPHLGGVKAWTTGQFISAMRTGVTPFNNTLEPTVMPWQSIGRLDDVELTALYLALVSLP